jgi:hypothetical protein
MAVWLTTRLIEESKEVMKYERSLNEILARYQFVHPLSKRAI